MESSGRSRVGQKRVILWSLSRSLSTAMCRVMLNSGLPTEVLFEPYGLSYFLGPERSSPFYRELQPVADFTYTKIKERQEMPYEGKELVFVKNQAYHLTEDRLTADWIPDGFTHTFLIRHPRDVMASLLRITEQLSDWTFEPSMRGFQQQAKLARLLKQLGHRLIVLDASDLMEDPEGMLRAYCSEVGIEYQDSMVHWQPLSDEEFRRVFNPDNIWEPCWFTNVRTSLRLTPKPRGERNRRNDVICDPDLRDVVEKTIQDNLKYYEELYALRITAK